jgi:hypothetical protein
MKIFGVLITLAAAIGITGSCYGQDLRAQQAIAEQSGTSQQPGAAVVILNIDGKDQAATASAYIVSGRLYIKGMWVEDSSKKSSPAAMASFYSLRTDCTMGAHALSGDKLLGTDFTALQSGFSGGRQLYRVFNADEAGGTGTVQVNSRADDHVSGTFSFTVYNKENPTETKTITGNFDVPYRSMTIEE